MSEVNQRRQASATSNRQRNRVCSKHSTFSPCENPACRQVVFAINISRLAACHWVLTCASRMNPTKEDLLHQALYQYIIKGSPCLGKLTVSLYCSPKRERMLMEHWIAFLWYLEMFFCFMNYKTQHPQWAKKWKIRKEGTFWTLEVCVRLVLLTMVIKRLWISLCWARRHRYQAGPGRPPLQDPGACTENTGSFPSAGGHRFPSLLPGARNSSFQQLQLPARSRRVPHPGSRGEHAAWRGERGCVT